MCEDVRTKTNKATRESYECVIQSQIFGYMRLL